MKFCNHCKHVGESATIEAIELRDDLYDRPATREPVEFECCEMCGSDDLATACECGEGKAECDNDCIQCTVTYYLNDPSEFDGLAPAWGSSPAWREAHGRILAALSLRARLADIGRGAP